MTKAIIAVSLDLDELELLSEIKSRYHQKNNSQALHTIIKQWQMMVEEKINAHKKTILTHIEKTISTEKPDLPMNYKLKKPVNPMVNP
jgi:hypothetical protein